MEQIAELLEAELVEITDGKNRMGIIGYLGSGLDAMKKTPEELLPFETAKPLSAYTHVILATPVWAGRCSSITRSFLIGHGKDLLLLVRLEYLSVVLFVLKFAHQYMPNHS